MQYHLQAEKAKAYAIWLRNTAQYMARDELVSRDAFLQFFSEVRDELDQIVSYPHLKL
jgi:hypothetical protein